MQLMGHMAGSTRYRDRYLRGEYEQVWAELLALGEQMREEPLYTDARAVAHEMMLRVQHNLGLLVPRLRELGYVFGYKWAVDRGILTPEGAQEIEQHKPFLSPPSDEVGQWIEELERRAGLLPLSLRAFYEVVGGVNFVGSHPVWGAYGLDALVVESAEQVVEFDDWMHWSEDKDAQGICELPIAPDEHHKYFVSGNVYTIRVPALAADVRLDGEWHDATFVEYLRTCFYWGGFPGWERLVPSSRSPSCGRGCCQYDLAA
jgi:hypothetical protein